VILSPADKYRWLANVYFGTGDSVLRPDKK